jgi:signal transduction histidine kinase
MQYPHYWQFHYANKLKRLWVGDKILQNTKNKIYFNFSYDVLKLLGDGLYSNPWTAISELIANGIDAEATKIYLYINMVNKQSSTIEIFDNGHGMNYKDLADKYALLGKNKRFDIDLNENQKNKVLGRKGIGKLAALYLAPTYYLISKTDNQMSSWYFDMNNTQNDDIPNLRKVNKVKIETETQWKTCKTGTLIKLVNVDLKNIGEQTIEGIKARIADYYAFNEEEIEILIAIKQNSKNKIVFQRVEKQIAFKNYYAFFDNTKKRYNKELSQEILLKTNIPEKVPNTRKIKEATKEVFYKQCPVKILYNSFQTSGEQKFKLENGVLSAKPYKYELIGWIGIHSTIEKREAKLNDNIFIRNKAYQPNRLRLYVRNKLAVENFMEYLHNTQAFGKYIEGEIHFDILDNNNLPDISTADREDYKEDDDRIQKLIEILKPIIMALIRARIEIGRQLRKEEEEYRNAKEAKEKERTEKAEKETRKARTAQDKAEKHSRKVEEELEQERKHSIFQRAIIGEEKEQILSLQHHIKHSASSIKTNVSNLREYLFKKHGMSLDKTVIKCLSIISIKSENILSIAKYVTNANYNLRSSEITEDLIRFIQEYINEIFSYVEKECPKINLINNDNIAYIIDFRPLEITSMIDNFIHNAQNAKAKNIIFSFKRNNDKLEINISDDGIGIPQEKLSEIYNFGFTTTDGSGIGLYIVKKSVENLKGRIEVVSKERKGTTFTITL